MDMRQVTVKKIFADYIGADKLINILICEEYRWEKCYVG
uniref:Uncharacterized protein n=1 Tax=Anguilla anguilla TaxID=7936 RepID=A0A0E9Q899_ANGAN